jgi:hypothetical protein
MTKFQSLREHVARWGRKDPIVVKHPNGEDVYLLQFPTFSFFFAYDEMNDEFIMWQTDSVDHFPEWLAEDADSVRFETPKEIEDYFRD